MDDLEQQIAHARNRRLARRAERRAGPLRPAAPRVLSERVTVHLDRIPQSDAALPSEAELLTQFGPLIRGRPLIARLLGLTPAALSRRIERGQAPIRIAHDPHSRAVLAATRDIAAYYRTVEAALRACVE